MRMTLTLFTALTMTVAVGASVGQALAQMTPGAQSAPPASADGNPAPAAGAGSTVIGEGGASPILPGMTPSAATADFPTVAAADYIFGCMASNGQTRTALERCSCSFDVIASLVSYDEYVGASTFLSMSLVTGEKGALFRTSAQSKEVVGDLRRAQAEAEIRCFE